MFPDLSGLIYLFWGLIICVPLAIWKLIDIAIWVFSHVSVSIQ